MTNAQGGHGLFAHSAFLYRKPQEYLDCLLPFIVDAVSADQAVLVALPGTQLGAVAEGLGRTAADVTMTDITEAGRNPSRILGELLSSFAKKHLDHRVCIIGEPVWPSRSEVEYPACVQHEALINRAFAGRDINVVCPYAVAQLDPDVIADARCTHPVLWQDGSFEQDNPAYDPGAVWTRYNQPLWSDPTAVRYTARNMADLSGARAFAGSYAQWFGMSPTKTADLQLIASELATSSLTVAGATCRLSLWRSDGHLVCEARDRVFLDDPLAGRRPYAGDTDRGRGLYVVNAVADLVRTHTTPTETTIHAYLRLEASQ